MKNLFSTAIKTLVVSTVFFMSSCLEDKGYLDIFNGENKTPVISFGGADYGRVVKTVEVKDEMQPLSITVNIARGNEDATIELELDPAALDAYNAAQLAADDEFIPYELLPDSTYDIETLTVNIPKGQLDAEFVFEVNSSKIDLSHKYILPVTIKSGPEKFIIASNFKTALVAVVVKNRWDGQYTMMDKPAPDPFTSTMADGVAPNLVIYKPWEAELVTNGPDEVILQDREEYFADPRIHIIKNGAAVSGYGTFGIVFKFDPATNKVIDVVNLFGQPASNGRAARLDPSGVNQWNPETKELRVTYWMIQDGSDRTKFDEYYRYDGPRP